MQRIVMEVFYTDECTYSYTETYPGMHESPEAALIEFEKLNEACDDFGEFKFCGLKFWKMKSKDEYPEFYTVDEWFANAEGNIL